MQKYIDAEAFAEYMNGKYPDFLSPSISELDEEIKDFPAADVQEVKHGTWIGTYDDICSVCREISEDTYSYCPNCGAKMDGGK